MGSTSRSSLRFLEDLPLPQVQVVVMRANMECNRCRQRVLKVLSKMSGFLDLVVDVSKGEVTLRGAVDRSKKRKSRKSLFSSKIKNMLASCFGCNTSVTNL